MKTRASSFPRQTDSKEGASSLYQKKKMKMREGKGRTTTCPLSPSVWDKLPLELAERVFAHMPISSVYQCRCVCKKWSLILSSNNFLNLWGRLSPQTSWFLAHNSNGVAAITDISKGWKSFPVFVMCSLDPRKMFLVASSGGLLCFRTRSKNPSLTVCNPVTKCKRVLPGLLQIRYIQNLGMVADKNTNSYKILVTGSTEPIVSNSINEVYDSLTGCWVHHCNSEQDLLRFVYHDHAIWCMGSFYCLAASISSTPGCRLSAYNMLQKDWCDLNVQMPSETLPHPSLLACQGRLLLAGEVVNEQHSIKSVLIWELDWGTLEWREIDSMPSTLLNKILSKHTALQDVCYCKQFLSILCYGNTDLICFSGHISWHTVIYDLSRKTWYWIPRNKACKEPNHYNFGRPFEPNLVANV